jgi:DNA-directed RNA polymerase subunit RPC12/RpoP
MSHPAPPPLPEQPAAPRPETAADVRTTACAGCGARVEFAPGTTVLRCPYCGQEQQIKANRQIREHPFGELAQRSRTALATHVWTCARCGATTDSDGLATKCQFCTAPLVRDADAIDQIAPEAVVPFGVDRAGVRGALRKWVASRWFAPRSFRSVSEAESLSGTYVPHWTFDADTRSVYTGERGDHYWVTETYTTTDANGNSQTNTRQVQRTAWHHVSGEVSRSFDDVTVRATGRLEGEHQDKLEPWPLDEAVAYTHEYLAGYSALRYDVEPEAGLTAAQEVMAGTIRQDCRRDIGGDEQRVHSVDTDYSGITYKLVLLPVWVVAYMFAGKTWQVLVNGRTGEVVGSRPYSAWKIAAAVLAALVVIAAIVTTILITR